MFGFGKKKALDDAVDKAASAFVIRSLEDGPLRLQEWMAFVCTSLDRLDHDFSPLLYAVEETDKSPDFYAATMMAQSLLPLRNLFEPALADAIRAAVWKHYEEAATGERDRMPRRTFAVMNEFLDRKDPMFCFSLRFAHAVRLQDHGPELLRFMSGPLFSPILSAADGEYPTFHFWKKVKEIGLPPKS